MDILQYVQKYVPTHYYGGNSDMNLYLPMFTKQ